MPATCEASVTHDEALTAATRFFADALCDGVTSEQITELVVDRPLVAGYVLANALEFSRTGLSDEEAAIVAASLKSSALKASG